ncbi:ATP-binding protein [Fulvimarina sp. MAC8]|uniref:ATP-binding protein n=1 Tax=Fulvimarina sp. MAC8 TaxID=3162874 RepID=UPI0032EC83E1
MARQVKAKWRPSLTQILLLMMGAVLFLPLAGVGLFRIYENHLVSTTEGELIAQSAAIAAAASAMLETQAGAEPAPATSSLPERTLEARYVTPLLSLGSSAILGERPDARPAQTPATARMRAIGQALDPILRGTQGVTLAGFRVVDANGTVIAGRGEIGQSLAHIATVQTALEGHYASELRTRTVDNPQPIYSISRGTNVRVFTALPFFLDGTVAGAVYASRTPSNILKELYLQRERVAYAGLTVLALSLVIGIIFARAIGLPIHALTARMDRIGHGDRSAIAPLKRYGSREIASLAEDLFDNAGKLFDRKDYIEAFAAHVQHEMKTPLTAIRGAAELLAESGEEMDAGRRRKFHENILADTVRMNRLLDRLRDLARAENATSAGSTDLRRAAESSAARYPDLRLSLTGDAVLPLSPEAVGIVLDNLIDNAVQNGAGKVVITGEGRGFTVADDGNGISAGNVEKIFEPFFTTRRETGGTGLGLAIIAALLRSNDGSIELVSSAEGAAFRVRFD